MKAALYARTSREEDGERHSIAAQLHELHAYARRHGHEIAGEFIDDGHSGSTLIRPALTQVREAARLGTVQGVVVYCLDRLSREPVGFFTLWGEFQRAGIAVEFVTMKVEDSPEGELILGMLVSLAKFEKQSILRRMKLGKEQRARRGLSPGGGVPYGFRLDSHNPGKLAIDEAEAAIVRMIYRWAVDEGRSLNGICTELRRLGVPAPRLGWSRSHVHKILTRRAYIGEWACANGIILEVPAIVTPSEHQRAAAILERNKALKVGRPGRFFLLRGLLRCERCGRRMVGAADLYRCQREVRCKARGMSAAGLDATIWETVTAVIRNPKLLATKLQAHRDRMGVQEIDAQSEAEHLRGRLRETDSRVGRLLDALADGIAPADVKARLADLERERQGIRERLAQAEVRATTAAGAEDRGQQVEAWCRARRRRGWTS